MKIGNKDAPPDFSPFGFANRRPKPEDHTRKTCRMRKPLTNSTQFDRIAHSP
jgi:hypothetical protein